MEKKLNKLQKFIVDNKIDLTEVGSSLNSTCVILAGFALYLNGDTNDFDQVVKDIEESDFITLSSEVKNELERVFTYAYRNNYFQFWQKENAHNEYIFDSLEEN